MRIDSMMLFINSDEDDYATNSHDLTYTFLFKRLGESTFGMFKISLKLTFHPSKFWAQTGFDASSTTLLVWTRVQKVRSANLHTE